MQAALLRLYLDGTDELLWARLRLLLGIVAGIELFDGLQTVLGGVVQVRALMPPNPECCSKSCSALSLLVPSASPGARQRNPRVGRRGPASISAARSSTSMH